MNKYTIEKRDKEVVEKFRAVVESREQRKKLARTRLFSVLLVFACAGLIFLYKNFSQPPVSETEISKSNVIAVERTGDDSSSIHEAEVIQPPEAETIAVTAIIPDTKPVASDQEIRPVKDQVVPANKMTRKPVPVLKPRVKASGKVGLAEIDDQQFRETDIQISEIVICQGIKNKKAVSPQNLFSLQKGAKPYVWMDVRSKKTPYKLRHVYYLNGRRYCEVPLAIHYPRMRTWSNVTLRNQYEAGQWRVDVVTKKGKTLSQVEFTVVP